MTPVKSLVRFILVSANARELAAFYEAALGCQVIEMNFRSGTDFEELLGVNGGAKSISLALGPDVIEVLQFDHPGSPYPGAGSASDLFFQHFAIIVADIGKAYERLKDVSGWTPISIGGPQQLPVRAGGVAAFKFRDPEGHPLELLAFPNGGFRHHQDGSGLFLGIDHSALSVSDSDRSVAFYGKLGLQTAARSLNHGHEQQRLDAVPDPHVEVTAMIPAVADPHIELLGYQFAMRDDPIVVRNNDIAATRLVFEAAASLQSGERQVGRQLLDPDGHHLLILPPAERGNQNLERP